MSRTEERKTRNGLGPASPSSKKQQEPAHPNGPQSQVNGSTPDPIVLYVVGGGGAGRDRNPALRDFPLLNRGEDETDAAHLTRVARQIDRAAAAGGTHLVVPREHADWLGDHPLLAEHFAERHELIEASDSGGIVFALRAAEQMALRATVAGWQIAPGADITLYAPRKLVEPMLTLYPTMPARGLMRGHMILRTTGIRTLQVRFVLGRADRQLDRHLDLFLSLDRPGYLIHELPFVEASFAADGSVRLEFDLKVDRGRSLERIEITPAEEDNWRLHPMYPDGRSIALPTAVPAGSRLALSGVTLHLQRASKVRKGSPHGQVNANRPTPYRKPPGHLRDAVIFSSWVPDEGLALGDYFIDVLRRWHADSKIFVGVNHGSSPQWRSRLEASGLDVVVREASPHHNMASDPPGFVAALDAFRRYDEPFDLVWFGHTKGLGHCDEFWYATGRWTIERMYWSRRAEIERHFADPSIGLYSPHYLMLLQGHLAQIDALQSMYKAPCAPLGAMAVSTHYAMRAESVRAFCANVDPRFFRDGAQPFGGDIYFFEMGMPNVPLMQGYEPAIEPGRGGTSDIPPWHGIASVLKDWRQNNAVVAIELQKWRQDPTRFRTQHAEHNRLD